MNVCSHWDENSIHPIKDLQTTYKPWAKDLQNYLCGTTKAEKK